MLKEVIEKWIKELVDGGKRILWRYEGDEEAEDTGHAIMYIGCAMAGQLGYDELNEMWY